MTELLILSPFDGWAAPLGEAPDLVFAQGMLGDGVAVDPTSSRLLSPMDAVVVSVAPSGHAVTLRSSHGVELVVHIGVDTVRLGGAGFEAHVRAGQNVRAGDLLVTVDLEAVARAAPSLITPVIVSSGTAEVIERVEGRLVAAGQMLLRVRPMAAVEDREGGGAAARRTVVVPLRHGLHARPAARLAAALKGLDARLTIGLGGQTANGASAVSLMALGVGHGDEVELAAAGPDAARALAAVAELIESGMGEGGASEIGAAPAAGSRSAGEDELGGERVIRGVTAAPGLALGRAVRLAAQTVDVVEEGEGVAQEDARLSQALARVRSDLDARAAGDARHGAIFAAHAAFLEDPDLLASAQAAIRAGRSAGHAWRVAIEGAVDALQRLGGRMAERADDLRDVERQVLERLAGVEPAPPAELPPDAIVVAETLTPSQFAALDSTRLAGVCTSGGGPTSHVAILAAGAGVPVLAALGPELQNVREGQLLLMDADAARLVVEPAPETLTTARRRLARRSASAAEAGRLAHREGRTADGVRIEVFANLGGVAEAGGAVAAGAEGCGLLRTEFLFLDRDTAPDEDEQHAHYQTLAAAMPGLPVIVRTLDAGGDKPLPYLPMPVEENPALGLRGVRTSLARPDLLRTQLRAILRVEPYGQCRIMLPMISSVAEVRAVRAILEEEARALGRSESPMLGVMVETPAAAMLPDQLAREADFLSIGTNDLTQYVLAMDRGSPQLAPQLDPLHPAVLRLIARTAEEGRAARFVGVCGGLASDPAAAPLLVGLGVTELSAVTGVIGEIKAALASTTLEQCRALAREALEKDSARSVRALLGRALHDAPELELAG